MVVVGIFQLSWKTLPCGPLLSALERRGVNFASRIFCHSIPQDTEGFAPKLHVPLSGEVLAYSLEE